MKRLKRLLLLSILIFTYSPAFALDLKVNKDNTIEVTDPAPVRKIRLDDLINQALAIQENIARQKASLVTTQGLIEDARTKGAKTQAELMTEKASLAEVKE